jgi:AcrR family transcriptional regulator
VAAVLPLILERGATVTSRELAAAAGVAEGTLFRAFGDKDQLIGAVVESAVDPTSFERAVRRLDPAMPFEERIVAVTALMQRRMLDLWRLLHQLDRLPADVATVRLPDNAAVVEVFERERASIRLEPLDAARRLRAMVLALSNAALIDPPLSAAAIVDMFLHGIASQP